MGQKDISSFFGKAASKPAAPGTAAFASKAGGSGEAAAAEGGGKLKRLKRTAEASPAKSAPENTGLEDDVELVDVKAVAAPPAEAPPAKSPPAKVPAPTKTALPKAAPAKAVKKPAAKKAAPAKAAAAKAAAPKASTPAAPAAVAAAPAAAPAAAAAAAAAGAAGTESVECMDVDVAAVEAAVVPSPAVPASSAAASESEDSEDVASPVASSLSAGQRKFAAAFAQAPAAAAKKQRSKALAAATEKVDGVGSGAVIAAALHAEVDVAAMVTWKAKQPVPYAFLADTFEEISGESKRLALTNMLIGCFRAILSTTPEDLLPCVYMCVNRVAPAHDGIELGIGEGILVRAIAESSGCSEAKVKNKYGEVGDLGIVAVDLRTTQKTLFPVAPLTIQKVFKTFRDIAAVAGKDSVTRKVQLILKLMVAAKRNEPGYIIRSLQAKLRIGLAEQSVLTALSHAVHLHKEEQQGAPAAGLAARLYESEQIVKMAYSGCPSYEVLIPALLAYPIADLPKHCVFMPGVPIKPMLAKPTNGVAEVLEKFGGHEFTCEYKYDGERAQVHVLEDGSIRIFSRSSENATTKYPDVIARLPALLKEGVKTLVFDAEAVAWDVEQKRILPFQVLSTRKRKDVEVADVKVQVVIYAFDLLYLNGVSFLERPLTERRQALYASLQEKEGQLQYAIEKTSNEMEELELFLNESVAAGTEGLIVKTLHDTYEPSKRSSHWLKLKKDYMEGAGDTFDVVPVGAFYGKGKRAGVYGAYLLAVFDAESGQLQTISKCGTGFSETQLDELYNQLKVFEIPKPAANLTWGEARTADVWFSPEVVWEVKCADLSISPVYTAATGLVDPDKGISIRFPRLVRVRDDKKPEDATTAEQVAEMYNNQATIKANKKAAAGPDESDAEEDDAA